MPFDGNGGFDLKSPEYPAIAGTTIEAADWNAILEDFASAFENCVTRDGQGAFTGEAEFVAGLKTNEIAERTSGSGVTVDGVLLKDGEAIPSSGTYVKTADLLGLIAIWSGAISDLAAQKPGWGLCDGTLYGTVQSPDLTDSFVLHADAYSSGTNDVGDTGGESTHSLILAELAAHGHDVEIGAGTPTVALDIAAAFGNVTESAEKIGDDTSAAQNSNLIATTGSGDAHNNRDKYYALAYIIKHDA